MSASELSLPTDRANASDSPLFDTYPTVRVGGLNIAALNIEETTELMIRCVKQRPRGSRPLFMTSANGEVISRAQDSPLLATIFAHADMINPDGQPLVFASRLFCAQPLPERVATTDLFEVCAAAASREGVTFYMLGATESENRRAVEAVKLRYPRLNIVGRSHGYLKGAELEHKIDEINALGPDILWLSLGVPREQMFAIRWSSHLTNVGIIKTSGGLLNFLSGSNRRAPVWMQKAGFEWVFRIWQEPRRLFWRYFVTNPKAFLLLLRSSG